VAGAVTAPAPAARVVEAGLAAPGDAAEAAAREPRLVFHAVEAAKGKERVAATGEGAGVGPLAFAAAFRDRRGRLLLFEGPPHDLVHEGESHPENLALGHLCCKCLSYKICCNKFNMAIILCTPILKPLKKMHTSSLHKLEELWLKENVLFHNFFIFP
jgi:hypothetical protein